MVLVVVDDLIFFSKIEHTARTVGLQLEAAEPANVVMRIEARSATALLIDLNHRSGTAVEVIRAIKGKPRTATTQVIGYLSHVQGDLAAAARAAGCDVVMARSAFTQQLPQLLRKLAEPKEGSVADGS